MSCTARSVRRFALLGLSAWLALAPSAEAKKADRWDQFRRPASGTAAEFPMGDFGLRVAWTRDLGSGYSNIWMQDDRAVTMFADDGVDVVAALSAESGEELWRYELGETYAGHDGSDDGPVGTPTVSDDAVYALGPRGQLVALGLSDGKERWRHELTEENSTVPFYGYTTSPVVAGKLLLVATGGEGHMVTAYDRASGKVKWASGDDSVFYQTPMLVELGGKPQLLAVTDFFVQGLDIASGKILWQLRHTEEGARAEQAAHPTMLDGDEFLIKYGRDARLYRYTDGKVEQVWQTRAFGNTYALPVLRDGHFYGFTGTVMTCVDAKTGEIVWRSRDVSGRGLADVGGDIAVLTLEGELALMDPSPEGYKEVARIPVLDNGDYAVPSFGNGQLVVRNLQQVASVRLDSSMTPQTSVLGRPDRFLGDFGNWISRTEKLPEGRRQGAVDERFASLKGAPIVGERFAHVVWRGDAEDVAVTDFFVGGGQELALHRIDGTDLFYRSFELDPKANYSYSLIVDFGQPDRDPRNPLSVDNGFAVASELRMPQWPESPHLQEPAEDAPRGQLDSFPFRSEIMDNTRDLQVWRPPGYGQDADKRYPLLVVNHGDNVVRGGLMRNTLDNLVGGGKVAPIIAVFVPRGDRQEYGGTAAADYTRFLVEELLPHLDRHYRTDPDDRAIMGPASAGVAAIHAALTRGDVFKKAATQSFYPIEPVFGQLSELVANANPKPELIYTVWSENDYDFGPGRQAEVATKELMDRLREAGINLTEQVAHYSPNWAGWRGQDDEILAALFPPTPADP